MSYLMVGVGQGGSALLDSLLKYKPVREISEAIAINSTAKDLLNLKNIKKDKWIGISGSKGFVEANNKNIVFEDEVTGGFGKNSESAAKVANNNYSSLVGTLRGKISGESSEKAPFAFIFNSLGGGTGCGVAPHVAKALKDVISNVKIITFSILPPEIEKIENKNAAKGMKELKENVDSVFLIDNQKIAYRPDYEVLFQNYNDYVSAGIADLISGVILEDIDPSKYEINPPVLDLNDLITATSFDGEPGFAAIGRSSTMTRSLLKYYLPLGGHKDVDLQILCKVALGKLTLDNSDYSKASKGLVLVRTPVYYLKKEGRLDIRTVRDLVSSQLGIPECHIGITITKRNLLSLNLILTFEYDKIDRINNVVSESSKGETQSVEL